MSIFNKLKSILLVEDNKPKEPIIVSLEELSTLWMKYNDNFIHLTASVTESPETEAAESQQAPLNDAPDASQSSPSSPSAAVPPTVVASGASTGTQSAAQPTGTAGPVPPTTALSQDSDIQAFVRSILTPYEQICRQMDALEGIKRLLDILEKYGDCPSIVSTGSDDKDSKEYPTIKQHLTRISLKSHSILVARIGVEMLKASYGTKCEPLIPKVLVATLGHDLGKIPAFRQTPKYSKYDHPIISAELVVNAFRELIDAAENEVDETKKKAATWKIKWLTDAIQAIKDHHRYSNEPFLQMLRKADGKAREKELARLTGNRAPDDWAEWLNAQEILDEIYQEINTMQTGGNRYSAFTYGGNVYCDKRLFYLIAQRLQARKKIVCSALIRESDAEEAIKAVIDVLRDAGAISPEIGSSYYGRLYEVETGGRRKKSYLVPLRIEAFGTVQSELDKKKPGYLYAITSVKPAN
ncbi:MAG TPA: HD domain-containing protein [Methanoregulaceae archaeon]|nr:HD domain-containing protein [Sedimentisphaerales bacterium]HPD11449.1 HD domain-containing protein [Methanoregulaceae archaeon]